jgi:hypothetical protein
VPPVPRRDTYREARAKGTSVILKLVEMPPYLKGPDNSDYKGMIPRRMRFLAPDVGPHFLEVDRAAGGLVVTDMWRSADSSLAARRIKRGVQRPGYSPHGFGLAVDLDLYEIMKMHGVHYTDIVEIMKAHGWYCHRRDGAGPDESEAWHFNYLGDDPHKYLQDVDNQNRGTWSNAVEARIFERYGNDFSMTPIEIQTQLAELRLYGGEIDGDLGTRLCRESIMAFQRTWDLAVDGDAGVMTQRTMAFVTAKRQIIALPTT